MTISINITLDKQAYIDVYEMCVFMFFITIWLITKLN